MTWTSEAEKNAAAEKLLGLAYYLAHKYRPSSIPKDEALDLARLALADALNTYDPARGTQITTWLAVKIRSEYAHHIRMRFAQKRFRVEVSLDAPAYEDGPALREIVPNDDRPFEDGAEDRVMLAAALNALPARHRQVVDLYFFQNFKQHEIAQLLSISQIAVSRTLTAALKNIRACI